MSQLHAARRFAAVLFVLVLAVSCREGGARSYSLDEVVVSARVDRDGSLWIDETRTYTYDGRYSWAEFRLPLDRVGRGASAPSTALTRGPWVVVLRLRPPPRQPCCVRIVHRADFRTAQTSTPRRLPHRAGSRSVGRRSAVPLAAPPNS